MGNRLKNTIRDFFQQADLVLLGLCVGATLFGLVLIYSCTRYMDRSDALKMLLVQTVAMGLGIIAYLILSMVDTEELIRHWKWFFAFNVGFICLLVPFGRERYGNKAWIQFNWMPMAIQPTEIVKITFILLLAWQALGRGFLVRTAVCTVTSSLFLSLVPPPAAPLVEETLTNCVRGGILVGFSLGIVLTCGCSTGGLDILGLWLAKKGKGFSVGRFSLSFNALLYTLCAVLFGLRAAIYSIIYTVFCALFIDRGHQQNITEQVLIFTKDEDPELPRNIMARLGRGVTYWEGKGAYTGEDLRVLCVCVSKFEEADLYGVVHELDPNAFFITQEGVTIHGNFIRKLS